MKNVRDCRPGEKGTPMLKIVDNDPAGENSRSILDDLVREGARRMLVTALEIEIETYVQSHHNDVDDDGHRLVVRNGTSPVRSIKTGAGPLEVEQPRINDRRVDPVTGKRQKFSSAILPPWARSSPNINDVLPLMYLHGMSSSDFCRRSNSFVEQLRDYQLQRSPGSRPSGKQTIKRSTTSRSLRKGLCTYGLTVSISGFVSLRNGSVFWCSWALPLRARKN
jgi:hypothetical protein